MDISTIVSWAQVAIWAVVGIPNLVRWLRGQAKVPTWLSSKQFLVTAVLIGLATSGLSLYLNYYREPICPSYLEDYGIWPNGNVYADVNAHDLMKDKNNWKVMILSYVYDAHSGLDPSTDSRIVKSATNEISQPHLHIEIPASPDFVSRVAAGKSLSIALIEVPNNFPVENIHDLSIVEKLGGKVLEARGVLLNSHGIIVHPFGDGIR